MPERRRATSSDDELSTTIMSGLWSLCRRRLARRRAARVLPAAEPASPPRVVVVGRVPSRDPTIDLLLDRRGLLAGRRAGSASFSNQTSFTQARGRDQSLAVFRHRISSWHRAEATPARPITWGRTSCDRRSSRRGAAGRQSVDSASCDGMTAGDVQTRAKKGPPDAWRRSNLAAFGAILDRPETLGVRHHCPTPRDQEDGKESCKIGRQRADTTQLDLVDLPVYPVALSRRPACLSRGFLRSGRPAARLA